MKETIKVLVVDDNARYRTAFSQNLVLQGMSVIQAEHADQALDLLKSQQPDVLVTDLQMRRAKEGLDLIRDARAIDPCLPVIMISAVGSFDEGAQASQLGASYVLGKARIDEEMGILYDCIRKSHADCQKARAVLREIAGLRASVEDAPLDPEPTLRKLRGILDNPELSSYVKAEAFDLLNLLSEAQLLGRSQREAEQAKTLMHTTQQEIVQLVQKDLEKTIASAESLEPDTLEALRTAEYLFRFRDAMDTSLELSRTICFSYCFAVENQTKFILRKRLSKFLSQDSTYQLIERLREKNSDSVSMFLQQHLLQIMRDRQMDFTIDNVRQTFARMLAHRAKYRPDGLKALGIVILVFGRTYSFRGLAGNVEIDNPLGIRGLDGDEETVTFARMLINLQHSRNPYVHPEISGQQTISAIRGIALDCLNLLMRLK